MNNFALNDTGGRKASLAVNRLALAGARETLVQFVCLEECLSLFWIKLVMLIDVNRNGEHSDTSTSSLFWEKVKAHVHVIADVDAGVLADRLAVPAQLVYCRCVLVRAGRSLLTPRSGSGSSSVREMHFFLFQRIFCWLPRFDHPELTTRRHCQLARSPRTGSP